MGFFKIILNAMFFIYRVFEILKNIASGKEEIDMERMKAQIHRTVLEEMNAVSYKT